MNAVVLNVKKIKILLFLREQKIPSKFQVLSTDTNTYDIFYLKIIL